jgi:hypothetical protein
MCVSRRVLGAVLGVTIAAGFGLAICFRANGDDTPTPDQQVKELVKKYRSLPDKAQLGPEGDRILTQLKAVRGPLSAKSRDAIARLQVERNLRQIALAIHNSEDKNAKKARADGTSNTLMFTEGWPNWILPYIEQPRLKWEYKVLPELAIRALGKDDFTTGLNKLGEDSWELVGVDQARFIFKRRK